MGQPVDRDTFTPADYERFAARLREQLGELREVLAPPGFGAGPRTLGAELELFLVDAGGRALPLNQQVLARARDPRVALEIDRFNLECNLEPVALGGRPFSALRRQLEGLLGEVEGAAAACGGHVVAIGILPTLREGDFGARALSPRRRYRALSEAIRRARNEPIRVAISGEDSLVLAAEDAALEGANTSLQFHLRVSSGEFARAFNAAQLATAPALAVAGNSPLFLGRRLWEETRVALFQQSIDERGAEAARSPSLPERVSFGNGWVREGAWELFAEAVALHPPLLPVVVPPTSATGVPTLSELRLHLGTVWSWNRPVYEPAQGGHLRIELRALPAGPSVPDMLANGAFLLGLTLGLLPEVDALLPALPFSHARWSFQRAAREGLAARLFWPAPHAPSPREVAAGQLVQELLPVARAGLVAAGVEAAEADTYLRVVEARARTGMTGARWQRAMLERLEAQLPRQDALAALLERYRSLCASGEPVHRWPVT